MHGGAKLTSKCGLESGELAQEWLAELAACIRETQTHESTYKHTQNANKQGRKQNKQQNQQLVTGNRRTPRNN
jgi:hypothetical protein